MIVIIVITHPRGGSCDIRISDVVDGVPRSHIHSLITTYFKQLKEEREEHIEALMLDRKKNAVCELFISYGYPHKIRISTHHSLPSTYPTL
ncbi:hypothetical protein PIB30_008550 [Stylosanthes scabra]|uniref:Uncharacterized protein n=1 Tax=Stylosanthes scabra TaxID=79078 RepID=A0ABU6Q527_9FABA|nr:hypothetical protein [Stylosanthes scabra]